MTKNEDPKKESLAEIAVDPDVLARELALEIEIDPLEQIDEDAFSKNLNISQECDEALKLLKVIEKSEYKAYEYFVSIEIKDLSPFCYHYLINLALLKEWVRYML